MLHARVIPQSDKDVLESTYAVNGNKLLVCYLSDVKHVLEVRDMGKGSLLHHLPLDIGSVDGISARRKDSVIFFQFMSFLSPGIIYECDLKTEAPKLKIFRKIVVPKFDRSEFQVDQNCFDDFISAAEFLISKGYTQPKKLCMEGGSNGRLLVGACINQRPDVFGCALAHVGVMDMLRFHKFTIGHAWTSDYGCSDKEEEFQGLIKSTRLQTDIVLWLKC